MRTVDPVQHRAKRRQVLDAAAPIFAVKGFDGATTAEICEAAGMSSGNVFHYFTSKRDIFRSIYTEEVDETAEQLAEARATDDPWEALLGFVDHLVAPATVPFVPALVLEAMLHATRDPEFAALLDRQDADEEAGVASLLGRAADAGMIDPALDPDRAASWVMALIGAVFLRAATSEDFDADEQLPTFRLILQRFLRGGVALTPAPPGDVAP